MKQWQLQTHWYVDFLTAFGLFLLKSAFICFAERAALYCGLLVDTMMFYKLMFGASYVLGPLHFMQGVLIFT